MNKSQKKEFLAGDAISYAAILALFEKIMGRKATEAEKEQMRNSWKGSQ